MCLGLKMVAGEVYPEDYFDYMTLVPPLNLRSVISLVCYRVSSPSTCPHANFVLPVSYIAGA